MEDNRNAFVRRLRASEHQAAVELVDAYYKQIYLFIRRLGHSQNESEDLTQEVFTLAWRHIGQLRNDMAISTWLYRIAVNASRTARRKRKGKVAETIENVPQSGEPDSNKAEEVEEIDLLQKAVTNLPMKLRQVIVLHYMQQLSIAEAARAAQIREGTFKSRLNRALKKLREQMK